MFAPNIIGHNDKKLGLLRSLVGGSLDYGDENGRRGRIHTMLVGDPGLAKSLLAREPLICYQIQDTSPLQMQVVRA